LKAVADAAAGAVVVEENRDGSGVLVLEEPVVDVLGGVEKLVARREGKESGKG
jgi:hypothetical protein